MDRLSNIVTRAVVVAAFLAVVVAAPAGAAPGAFGLIAPADNGWLGTAAQTFTWSPTTPAGLPIDSYWLVFDDDDGGAVEVDPGTCASVCSVTVAPALAEGQHTWHVAALDTNDDETDSEERRFGLDTTAPTAPAITSVTWTSLAGQTPVASLTWAPSTDAGSGVASYDAGFVAPAPFGSQTLIGTPLSTQTTSAGLSGALAAPSFMQQVGVRAVDAAGNRSPIVTVRYPTATFTPADHYVPGSVNKIGVLLPSLGVGPLSTAWDLDGDGTFETPDPRTATSNVVHSFTPTRPGTYAIGVRSTQGIYTVVLSRTITVDQPTGSPGIRFLHAARWISSRTVKLVLDYPTDTSAAAIAIGGGAPAGVKLGHSLSLPLPRSVKDGNVRLTATYAGYQRTTQAAVTIHLDTTRPTLSSAMLRRGTLRVKASDRVSGLKSIQLAMTSRSKPAKAQAYKSSLKITRAVWVRVIDKAGNASVWKRIAKPR